MPLIEDADYAELSRRAQSAEAHVKSSVLLDKIGNGPNRRKLLELIKEAYPESNIPELDAAKPVIDDMGKLREELAALRKQGEDDKAERAKQERERSTTDYIERNRKVLRDQGFQKEGIEAVEKLMQERGLTDYEAAAALFERSQPKDEPVLPNYDRGWNFTTPDREDEAESHKLLVSSPRGARKWQDQQVRKFFQERRDGTLRV